MRVENTIEQSEGFGRLEKHARQRLQTDNDIKIIIQGTNSETGIGKTTLAIQLCRRIDPGWSADEKAFVDVRKYLNAFLEQSKGSALLLDEIEHGADSRRAMSEDNVQLSQGWAKLRARNIATVATLPSVSMLDRRMLELADYWVLVKKRGVAQPFRIEVNDFDGTIARTPLGPDGDEHIQFPDLPSDDEDKEYLDSVKDNVIQDGAMEAIPKAEHEHELEKARDEGAKEKRDEILRELREKTDLTMRELSEFESIGVSHSRIGQITSRN